MLMDRPDQIRCAAVMQKERPLAESPQRRRAEFVRSGLALRYAVRQPWPHMVNGKIGKKFGHLPA
jgi:hypothetical protein